MKKSKLTVEKSCGSAVAARRVAGLPEINDIFFAAQRKAFGVASALVIGHRQYGIQLEGFA